MSLADRMPRRAGRSTAPPAAQTAPAPSAPLAPPAPAAATDELRRRRDALSRRFADLQWDLGGIAYEMASRDHFRLDVLTKQAAQLQEVDAELAGIERMLKLEEAGAAGTCPNCNALYSRGAAFCWNCGTTLIETAAAVPAAANGSTAPAPAAGGT